MKKTIIFTFVLFCLLAFFTSCTTLSTTPRTRDLSLDGVTVNEQDYGGCVRWYAVDKYADDFINEVRLQVGYFKDNEMGFVLYGDGTTGTEASFVREGLNLRWDWGSYLRDGGYYFRYSFIIEPDGTGLYYDFSTSTDGISNAKGRYQCKKF